MIVGTEEDRRRRKYAPLQDVESVGRDQNVSSDSVATNEDEQKKAGSSGGISHEAPPPQQQPQEQQPQYLRSPAPSARSVCSDRSMRSARSDRSRSTPTVVVSQYSPRIEDLRMRISRGLLLTQSQIAELEAEVLKADSAMSGASLTKVPPLKIAPLALMPPEKESNKRMSAESKQYERARNEAKAKRAARGLSA